MSTKSLKIGLVFDDSLDSNDGVQQYVKSLGRWLLGHGHDVKFIVGETRNAGELQPRVHSMSRNIRVRGNQNKMFLPLASSGRAISKMLKAEKFDILHVMMPTNPIMGSRVVARAGDVPVIGTFHMVGGTWPVNQGARILSRLQRRTLDRIDAFASVSSAAQAFESQYFGIESEVSPNMVDVSSFKSGKSKDFLRGEQGTIVFLGRLVERKGAIHLLEAVKILHRESKLSGIRVNICGDGELRGELEEFVSNHQLSDHVVFHGFIESDEKSDYLASADVAVFPSTGGEAFGIVLIEAMATGRCVVLGGNNSGYATVLGGCEEELLFEPSDHQVLADKINTYLTDSNAKKRAIEWQTGEVARYDVNVVGEDMVSRYRQTIVEKRSKS